MRKKMIYRKLI